MANSKCFNIFLKASRSEYDNQGLFRREGDILKNGCWLVERVLPLAIISDPFFPLRKKDVITRDLLDEYSSPFLRKKNWLFQGEAPILYLPSPSMLPRRTRTTVSLDNFAFYLTIHVKLLYGSIYFSPSCNVVWYLRLLGLVSGGR